MQMARKLDLDMSKVMGFWANTGQLLLSLEIPASLTISKKKKKLTLFSRSRIVPKTGTFSSESTRSLDRMLSLRTVGFSVS
jgi:hypothetical protein